MIGVGELVARTVVTLIFWFFGLVVYVLLFGEAEFDGKKIRRIEIEAMKKSFLTGVILGALWGLIMGLF